MSEDENRIDGAFHRLLGRTPTQEEKLRLYRVKDALGLDANDSLWLVLVALDYHRTLYEEIPKQLAGASEPLRALAHAPAIVQALKDTTRATEDAQGLWSRLAARGLAWGLVLGLALGIAAGTLVGVFVMAQAVTAYERWGLKNRIEEMETMRARYGAAYEPLKGWIARNLTVTPGYIVVDRAHDVIAAKSQDGKRMGIWIEDK